MPIRRENERDDGVTLWPDGRPHAMPVLGGMGPRLVLVLVHQRRQVTQGPEHRQRSPLHGDHGGRTAPRRAQRRGRNPHAVTASEVEVLSVDPVDELARLAALVAENEQLWAVAVGLTAENEQLRARVGKPEGLLEEARRAGKRQAAPFSRGKPKRRPGRPGRRSGQEHGHREPPTGWMRSSRRRLRRGVSVAGRSTTRAPSFSMRRSCSSRGRSAAEDRQGAGPFRDPGDRRRSRWGDRASSKGA
jgi:hypothetical protein